MSQSGSLQWQSTVASSVQVPDGVCFVARPDMEFREKAASCRSLGGEIQESAAEISAQSKSQTNSSEPGEVLSRSLVDHVRRAANADETPVPAQELLSGSEGFSHLGAMVPCAPANTPEIVIVRSGEDDSLDEDGLLTDRLRDSVPESSVVEDGLADDSVVEDCAAEASVPKCLAGEVAPGTQSQVSEVVSAELANSVGAVSEPSDAPGLTAVRAAWEVEVFQWPVVTNELLEGQSEVFAQLCGALRDLGSGADRVALTSLSTGEGRSTLSICLSRWAAAQGYRTLLVDADFQHGNLSNLAGLEFESGWQQMVSEVVPVEEFLVACDEVPLTLMCLQPLQISAGVDVAAAAKLSEVVEMLRSSFDLIILDCGTTSEIERLFGGVGLPADLGVVVRGFEGAGETKMAHAQQALSTAGLQHLAIADNFGHRRAA